MTPLLKMIGILLIGNIIIITSCKKKGCTNESAINYSEKAKKDDGSCEYHIIEEETESVERKAVIDNYNDIYLTSSVSSNGWTGSVSTCNEGVVSLDCKNKTLIRVNYFRNLAGLNSVEWDATAFPKYQKAALVMESNGSLSHTPPNTWNCWSQEAYDGAYSANLSSGGSSTASITSYIRDSGGSNDPCGHRRWILHSSQSKISLGASNSYHALGVVGLQSNNTEMPEFIAYPSEGFFPKEITFDKWSFGVSNANFSSSSVQMTDDQGNNISLTIVSKTDSYADNTIVWKPIGIDLTSASDRKYNITISNVSNSNKTSYSYSVELVKAQM